MNRYTLIITSLFLLFQCKPNEKKQDAQQETKQEENNIIPTASPSLPPAFKAFTETPVEGSDLKHIERFEKNTGMLMEEGYLRNGNKEGNWCTYKGMGSIKRLDSISHYHNGVLEGISITFDKRNAIEQIAHYKNNKLDGRYFKYERNRLKEELFFKNGKLDGECIYYFFDGRKEKEVSFKDGLQHGPYKQYNELGDMVIQYQYENGKKIAGGAK